MKKVYLANLKKIKIFIFALSFFLLPASLLFAQTVVPYTTPGSYTFTVPVGVFSITVSTWGGGGAGGGVNSQTKAGGGGEGGSFVRGTISVLPGATYTVVVGNGGTGANSANGGSGLASSFSVSGGGATLFNAIGGIGGNAGTNAINFGVGGNATNSGNIVSGSTTSNFYGGNGGNATNASSASSGGGGGSAGAGGNGGNGGSPLTVGSAGAGAGFPADAGVAGTAGRGSSNDGNGIDASSPGAGGSGARNANNSTIYRGGNGGNGQVNLVYTALTYKSIITSVSAASIAPWCPGESRSVQVTIKNNGTATWTDGTGGTPVINVGVKWNINGANWTDYYIRTTAGNLAPGATFTYTLPLTASNNIGSGYTTPLASGTNNLIFDVVYEGVSWFGDNGGGVGPGNSKSSTVVTINSSPAITTQPSTATQTICQGSSSTALSVTATGAALTYQWYSNTIASNSSGTIISGATASSYTPLTTTAGTLYYYCIVSGTCTPIATSNVSGQVTVNPRPTAALSGTQAICNGSSATLSLAVTGSGTISGTLSSGTAFSGTAPTITVAVSPSATTTYTIATLTNGCVSIATDKTGTATVTVNPRPTAVLSGTQAICNGSSATLSLAVAGSGTISGTLSDGTAFSGTAPTITVVVSPSATISYTISTLTNGCVSIAGDKTGSATVTVNPRPTAVLSGTQAICNGSSATLSLAVTGSGTVSGTLSDGTTFSGTAPTITVVVSPSATITYSISTLTNGCVSIAADKTGTATVTVNSRPTAALSGTQVICNGSSATLSLSVTGAGTISGTLSDGTVFSGIAPTITVAVSPSATLTYTISTLTNGCVSIAADETGTAIVTVNPRPTAVLSGTQAICDGSSATLSLAVTGSGTISGTLSDGTAFTGTAPTITVAVSPSATTTYTIAALTNGCVSIAADATGTATVTVNEPVLITTNPSPFTQIVCATTTVNYSVTATGSGLTYQWLLNGSPLNNTVRITGVTTPNLQITGVTSSEAGTYSVIVSGLSPCASAISDTAHLDVDQRITFLTQPVSPQTICQGQPYIISASATGTIATFVWNKNGVFYANATFDGVNNYSLTIPTVALADAGNYQLILDDGTGVGCTSANTKTAILIVNPTPIATISGTATVCQSSTPAPLVTFGNPNALPVTITYNINSGGNLTINVGANTSATVAAPTGTAGSFAYNLVSVAYQSGPGCSNAITGTVTVTVNPTPDATATPPSQSICSGSAISTIALTGSVTGTVFNRTRDNATVTGIPTSGNGDISGSLTNNTSAPITVTFTIIPTASSCIGATITATVIVNPTSTVNTVSNQTICNNTPTTVINFSSPTTGGAIIYNWTNDTPSIGLAASGAGNIASFTATNAGTAPVIATITVTPSYTNGAMCPGTPITFTITVNPVATVNTVSNQTICKNTATTAVTFGSPATGGTIIYNWTNNTPSIGLAASGAGNIASFTATNTGSVPVTATITVTPSYTSGATCAGTPVTFTITVNPAATVTAVSNQTVCNTTATAAIAFSSPTAGGTIVYNWTNSAPSIGLAASGAGNIASFIATNAGTAPVTATITVTPSYTNGATCPGTPSTFTITVNPLATVNTVSNQTVCKNTATTAVAFGSPTTGGTIVYNWTNNAPSIGLAASGVGNIASFTATNAGTAPVTATITVTPSYTNGATCAGTSITFTITVNPAATVNSVSNQTVCNNTVTAAINFSSPTIGGTIVYNWTNNAPSIGLAASGAGNIASFNATNAGTAPVIATITVTPSYTNGATCSGTPITFTITVNPTATVTAVTNKSFCNNSASGAINFSSPTTGGAIIYNWTNNTPSIGLAASGAGNIVSFTATNAGTAPVTATIIVIPSYTNGATCPGTPMTFTITVNPVATVNAVSNQTVCKNTATTAVTFGSPTTGGTIVYNWTNNTPSIGLAASGAGNIAAFTATNSGSAPVTATITVTPSYTNGATCPGTAITFTVTVNPAATVNLVSNQTICNNAATAAITFNSPTTGGTIVYNWTNNAPSIGLAASGTGNITSFSGTNAGTAPLIATITVTPSYTNGATCTGTPATFTITVNPTPNSIATPLSQTKCSGIAIATIVLSTSATPAASTTYTWARDNTATVTGIAASGSGNISGILTNTTTVPVTVTFTITPSFSGCVGTTTTATVLVNPKPTAGNITNITGGSTVCIGSTITLTPAGSGIGALTYAWSSTVPSVATVNVSTGVVTGIGTGTTQITYTVSDANGCTSATSANFPVTVTKPTANAITGLASVCMNQTINLTANATGTGTLTYSWTSTNTGIATVTNTGIVTGIAAGTANIMYTVTDGNGCSTTSANYPISVVQIPTGTFLATENSGTPNNNVICAGSSVTFTLTPAGYGSYIFKVGGVTVQSGTSNVYSSSALTNGASVTVDVANSLNCGTTFGPIVITVTQLPVATLVADKSSICPGDNVNFTAGTVVAGNSYNFKLNGSSIQSGSSNTYSTTTLVAGNSVTVDVTNSNGCVATSSPVTVTVNPLPAGTLSSSGNAICAGGSITFTATSIIGDTYNFKVNGTSAQSGSANTYTTTTLTNGNVVTVDVTSAGGCTASFGPPQSITVNLAPTGALTPDKTNICTGSPVIFTATSGYANYAFYLNGIGTALYNGTSNVYTTSTLANNNYLTVVVTNSSNCTATFTSATINVATSPSGTLSASPTTICAGDNVDFTATAGFANYNFKINGTSFQNGPSNLASISTLASGDAVTVDVSNAATCTTTFSSTSVIVNALPTGTLVPMETSGTTNNDGTICTGANVIFTATPGFSSYNFKLNGVTIQFGAANTYSNNTLSNNDVVSVEVTSASGCVASFTNDTITVNPLPVVATITGSANVCLNSPTTLSDITPAGVWSSLNTGIATINAAGLVTGVSAGTATINYTVTSPITGCSNLASTTITVNTPPTVSPITGNLNVCTGSSSQLNDATAGGIWSSGNTGVATVDPSTGLVQGITPGTAIISYSVTDANGCTTVVTATVIVNDLPAVAAITTTASSFNVCVNSSIALADATSGGTWSSSDPSIATINASGVVTGVANGTSIISYNIITSCGQTDAASVTITVNPLPTGTINGTTVICQNSTAPNITFTGTSGTAPFTFNYNINGGTTQIVTTVSGNSVTVSAPASVAGSFTYNLLTVGDANSCSQAQAGAATVTVSATPTATAGGTVSVCQNLPSPNITFTGANGTAPYIFTYNINGGTNLTISSVGTTATIPVSTLITGAYTYTLVSVQDASATLCSGIQTGSATVTVTPASVGGSVAANAIVCSGTNTGTLTLSGQTGSVVRWEKSTDGGTTWSSIANTTTTLTYTNIISSTMYRAVVQSGACSSANSLAATISVTAVSAGGTVATSAIVCSGTNGATLTLSGQTGIIVRWESSIDGGTTWVTIANTTTSLTYGNLTQTTMYRAVVQNSPCSSANSAAATITVNPLPTATITGTANVCLNATQPNITFTGANGTAPYTFTYKINAGSNLTVVSVGNTATLAVPTATVGIYAYTLVSVKDASTTTCSQTQGGTATVTVNAPPAAFIITPASASICQGAIQSLTATANVSTLGSITVPSGTINVAIPDATGFSFFGTPITTSSSSVTTNMTVSTVPAGAVINSMSVNFNITHTNDNDLVLNIKAPNGKVLNLVDQEGNKGHNFTNTIVSSTGTNPFTNVTAAAPFTGTFAADADNGVGTPNSGTGLSFASLFSVPNGTWTLGAEDDNYTNSGTILNWSITFNYTIPNSPLPVKWSPVTDLYTDPGATTSYTGTGLSTVYSKPATSGTKTYTATASNGAGCTTSQNVILTVNPTPVVTITADYCAVAGKVQLTANATPAASSYVWSTGETTQTILVDEAGLFSVTAFSAASCPTTATISIANELVVNGNFESGDVGFTTLYLSHTGSFYNGAGTSGLYPEGYYAVDTSAFSPSNGIGYHPSFHGKDHTTGHGKFMMINGSTALRTIWQETANVLPNTTYYFSGWGMNLNPASPAQLQFAVNGVQTGSIGDLTLAPMPASEAAVSTTNWIRFYGTWTSGPTITSALISIVNLNTVAGGNDFGLDDISFSTLSTFIQLQSAPGTDAQTPCINTAITNIVYSVGSSASAPIVTGLPPGVTASFNGVLETISGTPTVAGNYSYTITTTGSCQPSSASGTINVQAQKITLTSGSASPTGCINNAIAASIVYTVSGSATGADVTGLPAGVTGSYNSVAKTFTISGTPTVSGVFKDTVITTGTCKADTAFGTITVQNQTIVLSSGSIAQTICVNTSISGIIYTLGGSATGAGVTGLPAGITGFLSGTSYILNGTPTASGTFNYTVTTIGTCPPGATVTGTITVNPAAAISLSSAVGTDNLVTCINSPMTNVTYAISGGGTNAIITSGALPAGITGGFSGGVFTIGGTPTAAGIFNYTISTTGTCAQATISGTITVQSQTIVLTSGTASPTLCLGSTLTNIVFTTGGTATGATLSGTLPTGITGSFSGNTYTIIGSPSQLGTFNYTVTTTGGCSPAAFVSGTIIVNNGSVGGTLPASISVCSGASGNLNLTGNTGNVVHWEQSVDNGTTWSTIANTTTTLPYTGTVSTQYRALVKSGSCTGVYSSIASIGIHNLWTGATSTDWNTASNWSDNQLPSTLPCSDVLIPGGTPNQPTLTGISTITNLHIFSGAMVTINGGTLQIAGTIINNGIFVALNGTIELNGSIPQTIPASVFQNNALNNLIISNTNATGVTLGGALDIYGSLTYTAAGKNLNTNGALTLKSTATQTAWIGNMTGHTIIGAVTVERYIATGNTHAKSWQLLAIPTQGQTIKGSWQEGATATNVSSPAPGSAGNPFAGFGTMLTSDVPNAVMQLTPGFDAATAPGPSIKVYNTLTDGYDGPTSTALPIYNQKGYFILVRGDRSVYTSGAAANPTVLRTKGTLFTPANLPPSTTVLAGKFESVGNPYASAIDIRKITMDANVNGTIIVWDPTLGLGSAYGLGAYQTLYLNGDGTNNGTNNYINLLPSVAYGPAGTTNNNIQSGQAFIIQGLPVPSPSGNLGFAENAKVSVSKLLMRPQGPLNEKNAQLRANLYGVNASGTFLADGALIQYGDNYSDALDGMDARKMVNTGENLAIKTAAKLLAIERRHTITQQDTIFLNLTGERVQAYSFEFIASNLDTGLHGFFEDNYLHTRTALTINGTTTVSFTIANIVGSYAPDRFRIVFAPAIVLPVTFTSVKAYRQNENINVEWRVENELNMKQYEVEKSTNGTQFNTLAVKAATANGGHSAVYVIADDNPLVGYNYYRVKSIDLNGKTAYTDVVRVLMGSIKQDITIYPNPITDGMIHLQLMNLPAGKYGIRMLNKLGQVIISKQISRAEGSSTELIKWDFNLAHGMYQLEVTKPDGSIKNINVLY